MHVDIQINILESSMLENIQLLVISKIDVVILIQMTCHCKVIWTKTCCKFNQLKHLLDIKNSLMTMVIEMKSIESDSFS